MSKDSLTTKCDIDKIREGLLSFQEGSAAPEYEQGLLDALDRLVGDLERRSNDALEEAANHFENIMHGVNIPAEIRSLKRSKLCLVKQITTKPEVQEEPLITRRNDE
ncbi:MAG: hypothetical protein WCD70_15015 [Alphaproteobacteria bacterium]